DVAALRNAVSAAQIESMAVSFDLGKSGIRPDQAGVLDRVAERAQHVLALAEKAHVGACLIVVGHADPKGFINQPNPPGSDLENLELSNVRSEVALRELTDRGVNPAWLRSYGAGVWHVAAPRGRSVTFYLDIDESRLGPGCEAER